MNKPNNYENTSSGNSDFTPVALGPHYAIIKEVRETQSKSGLDMIVVYIDFDKVDEQAGYFAEQYRNDDREDKKWPFQGTQYVLSVGRDGSTTKAFKQFCSAWEASTGKEIQWGGAFCKQFKNTQIGVNFGEVEEEYQGKVKTRRRIRWFFDTHKFDGQTVPEKKELPGVKETAPASNDWMNIPDGQDELPFR